MNNSIKKQSIVQSGPWGLEEFVAPLNKMGVKKSESMHSHLQDADLPLPFERINPVPYMHMVMTGRGPRPVQCRLPADNEIAVVDWVNFTDSVATLDIKFIDAMNDDSAISEKDLNFQMALEIEKHIEHIFGLQLTFADKGMKNRYQSSFEIGDKCGFVCVGGQRNTYLVMLTGRGRTLNIGSRESGKYLRLYEKGRAEGDPDDNWQRAEVEFKSKDRVLPFDMLLAPSEYFIAAYPCFLFLAEDKQPARIETMVKAAKINAHAALEIIKHQYGKYINIFKQVFEPEELINIISCSDPLAYPKRLEHVLITARSM
jgi:DNA relaxase NicK